MRNLSFSLFFPSTHPRAGQPTWFKEKILNGEKVHTIRDHLSPLQRGYVFRPVHWSEKPYRSAVVEVCEPLTVVETYPFSLELAKAKVSGRIVSDLRVLARNDGLSVEDFLAWFYPKYSGYIICWQPVNYVCQQPKQLTQLTLF